MTAGSSTSSIVVVVPTESRTVQRLGGGEAHREEHARRSRGRRTGGSCRGRDPRRHLEQTDPLDDGKWMLAVFGQSVGAFPVHTEIRNRGL